MDLRVIPAGFQVEGAGWLNWGQLSGWMPIRRDHTVYTHEYNLFTKDEIILHIRPIFLFTMLLIYITINMVQHHPFEWLIVFHCTAVLPLPNPLLRLLDVVLFLFFFSFCTCLYFYIFVGLLPQIISNSGIAASKCIYIIKTFGTYCYLLSGKHVPIYTPPAM